MARGRKPNPEPTISLHTTIPESWRARLDLILHSEVEGRVPKGAYQRFVLERLVEFFETRTLDLAPFAGTLPGELVIRGRPQAIDRLTAILQGTAP